MNRYIGSTTSQYLTLPANNMSDVCKQNGHQFPNTVWIGNWVGMARIWPTIVAVIAVIISIAGLEVEAKTIWSHSPVSSGRIIRDAFPIGNGRLGGRLMLQFDRRHWPRYSYAFWSTWPGKVEYEYRLSLERRSIWGHREFILQCVLLCNATDRMADI